jgi:hypothetical protein
VFQVQADLFTVDSVLRLVSVDTTEWGALQGAVDAQVVAAAATQERDPFGPIALRGTGALAGIVMSIDQHRVRDRIDDEAAGTARAAMYQKILVTGGADAATAAVGGAAPPLGIVLAAATPWVTESLSGPPARDYTPIAHAILVGRGRFKQQIAQGLIDVGRIPPPTAEPWFRDGRVQVENRDFNAFENWWGRHSRLLMPADDVAGGGYALTADDGVTNAKRPGTTAPRVRVPLSAD